LLRLKPVGRDIDAWMIHRAKTNLNHFRIEDFDVRVADATKIKRRYNYIFTDLPYGKNTKGSISEKSRMYRSFFRNLKLILGMRAVIVGPSTIDCRKMLKASGFKIIHEFQQHVHHTLTRNIFVIS